MNETPITGELGADPLSRLVGSQAGGKPAPAGNLAELMQEQFRPPVDEQFDPQLHESNPATGGPMFNADGSLRRKRGRRAGQAYPRAAGDDEAGAAGEGGSLPAPISPAAARAEAKLAAGMCFGTLESLLGPKWEPESEERDTITEALTEYIRETGGLGLPAWATVAIAFGGYALKRTPIGAMVGIAQPAPVGPQWIQAPDGYGAAGAMPGSVIPAPEPVPAVERGTSSTSRPPAERATDAA